MLQMSSVPQHSSPSRMTCLATSRYRLLWPIGFCIEANTYQKIRDRQLAAPTLSETLQDLVLNELKEKKHTATEGLVWLNRYVPSPILNLLANTYLQRSRLHCASPPPQHLKPQQGACRFLPRRLWEHSQAAPLVRCQAVVQRRHERHAIQEGLLCQAG